jgi:LysM repeat protein
MKVQHLLIERNLYQSKVFREFYEEVQKAKRTIDEAKRQMLEEQQLLTEDSVKLNAKQIDDIFKRVADAAAQGMNVDDMGGDETGNNRTFLGKASDAVTGALAGIKKKWDDMWKWIENTGPVQGFDVAFDQIQGDLLAAAGGENSKVATALQTYRQKAKEHPVLQAFILAAIAGLLGVAVGGGPVALAGIGFGIKAIDGLLKGDKASQAIRRGVTGAAIGYAAGQIIGAVQGAFANDAPIPDPAPAPGPDVNPDANPELNPNDIPPLDTTDVPLPADINVTDYTIRAGDTLSQLAADNGITIQDIMDANPNITNPNGMTDAGRLLQPGDTIKIPQSMDFSPPPVYAGGTGTLADTIEKMMTGEFSGDKNIALNALKADPSQMKLLSPEQAAWAKSQLAKLSEAAQRAKWIDKDATVRSWYLNESLGRAHAKTVQLTPEGVNKVFEQVSIRNYLLEAEGEEAAKKPGLLSRMGSSIGGALKKGWKSATNQITYEKLGMEWRKVHPNRLKGSATTMTSDSGELEAFLRSVGVKRGLIDQVYKEMGIPTVHHRGSGQQGLDDIQAASAIPDGSKYGNYTREDGVWVDAEGTEAKNQARLDKAWMAQNPDAGAKTADATAQPAAEKPAAGAGFKRGSASIPSAQTPATAPKVGDANDLIRDLEADKSKGQTQQAKTQQGSAGAQPAGKVSNPFAYDYAAAAKMAGIKPAAAKPDYSKTMPGYSSQKMTMKMPAAAAPAAATGQLGPRGVASAPAAKQPAYSGPYANRDQDDKMNYRGKYAVPDSELAAAMNEQRRPYGGKYVRESATDKLMREFEFFINRV